MKELSFTATLFVPGDRPDRFKNALSSGADAVILDLEDAVAHEKKVDARSHVIAALNGGINACVRINSPRTDEGQSDLEALDVAKRPRAIVLPKVESEDEVDVVYDRLRVGCVSILESVTGMERSREIARARGTIAVALGSHDLCAQLGAEPTPEVLATFRALIVLAARAAGVQVIDTPFLAINDALGLEKDALRSRQFGFDGKFAIHPTHIGLIHKVFHPAPDELASAQRILEAGKTGATVVDGMMVDAPILAAARRIVERSH